MKRLFLGIAALTAFMLLIAGGSRADSIQPAVQGLSSDALAARLQDVDDATLQKSAQTEADHLREIPAELSARGIQMSASQEERVYETADALQAQADEPGFREKVAAALRSTGHGLKLIGVDVAKAAGEGVGYAGTAALAASFTPVTFTGDLVMGIAVGHGVFSKDPAPEDTSTSSASHFQYEGAIGSGIGGFYLAYVGLDALGYTIAAPVIGSALGVVAVNWLVCARFDNSDNAELSHYCSNNAKLARAILRGSARGGAIVGEGIRKGVRKAAQGVWHVIRWPFHPRSGGRKLGQNVSGE